MRKYDKVQQLLNNLRDHANGAYDMTPICTDLLDAINEIEEQTKLLEKQQKIIRRVYTELLPDTWFVSGEIGEKDQNGLPELIEVCPAYGVGWSQVYEKTDRIINTEGS